jgi:hypothetical protein
MKFESGSESLGGYVVKVSKSLFRRRRRVNVVCWKGFTGGIRGWSIEESRRGDGSAGGEELVPEGSVIEGGCGGGSVVLAVVLEYGMYISGLGGLRVLLMAVPPGLVSSLVWSILLLP